MKRLPSVVFPVLLLSFSVVIFCNARGRAQTPPADTQTQNNGAVTPNASGLGRRADRRDVRRAAQASVPELPRPRQVSSTPRRLALPRRRAPRLRRGLPRQGPSER